MERIVILGAKGRLGSALVTAPWPVGTFVLPATREQLDITDQVAVRSYMRQWRPDLVINAAGFSSVDGAEQAPEHANRVNHRAVQYLAEATAAVGAGLLHFSTSYVFDGVRPGPYRETDQVNPLGAYGRSKRAGELAALALDDSVVIRTCWLYGSTIPGWLAGIHRLGRRQSSFSVIHDRIGSPTSATELAAAVVAAIAGGLPHRGLFHLAAPDGATWWDVADYTLRLDGRRQDITLRPLTTEATAHEAVRPTDAMLSSDRFGETYGVTLRPWREALADAWPDLSLRISLREALARHREPAADRAGATNR